MNELVEKKNHDYSKDNSAFENFQYVEALDITTTEQGFLTRITDKLSRINNFVKRGKLKVSDESVNDTLLDLANYSILMSIYLKEKTNDTLTENIYEKIKN